MPFNLMPARRLRKTPPVTVVVPTRAFSPRVRVVEAALRTYTRYPAYDLQVLAEPETPLHEIYDRLYETAPTPYWITAHDDLLILARDWLADLIAVMEREPDLYLVACQRVPGRDGVREPVAGEIIDAGESLSTWLFCVRTELRDRLGTSFAFSKDPEINQDRTNALLRRRWTAPR